MFVATALAAVAAGAAAAPARAATVVDTGWGAGGFLQETVGEALWEPVRLFSLSGGRVDALVTTRFLGGARQVLHSGPNGQSPSLAGGGVPEGERVGLPGAAVRLPDGRFVTAATRAEEGPLPLGTGFGLAAARPDGKPDRSFGVQGLATVGPLDAHGQATSVAFVAGRLLVAGRTGADRMVVARFTARGQLDTTFGSGGFTIIATPRRSTTGPVFVVPLGAGRFAVAGTVRRDGTLAARVAVAWFGPDGRQQGRAELLSLATRPSPSSLCGAASNRGRLVLVGALSPDPGGDGCPGDNQGRLRIARLTPSGHPDRAFNGSGFQSLSFGSTFTSASGVPPHSATAPLPVYTRADGRIVVGGALAGSAAIAVARFLSNGRPDPSLGGAGRVCTRVPAAYGQPMDAGAFVLAPGPSGRIYAATVATVAGADDSLVSLVRLRAAARRVLPCAGIEIYGPEATVGGVLSVPASISIRVAGEGTVRLGSRPAGAFAIPWRPRVGRRLLRGTYGFEIIARPRGSRRAAVWPAETVTVPEP